MAALTSRAAAASQLDANPKDAPCAPTVATKETNNAAEYHDPLANLIDALADLLSWRDTKRSVVALTLTFTCFYYALFKGYGLFALVAYSLLIRIVYVQAVRVFFHGGGDTGTPQEPHPWALSNTVHAWKSIEALQDYGITLRVVLMLWAVAFLGRIVSDAQLVFGFALFVFGKSVRWAKRDRQAAADEEEEESTSPRFSPRKLRKVSWQDAIRMVSMHERTKKHLMKLPSKMTSVMTILGGCYVWAVVITPVDVAVFLLVCFLSLMNLKRQERGLLIWQVYESSRTAATVAMDAWQYVQHQVQATRSEDHEPSVAKQGVDDKPRAVSPARSLNPTTKASINRIEERKETPRSPSALGGPCAPVPTPSVDELLKQHMLKPTLDGYQEASSIRHELTKDDIANFGYWLTPKGQKRYEPSTMPKYF